MSRVAPADGAALALAVHRMEAQAQRPISASDHVLLAVLLISAQTSLSASLDMGT